MEENHNFERKEIYGKEIVKRVSECLNKEERTIYKAIQFAKKYPDLNKVPEGKAITWHKICKKLKE